MNAVHWHIVLDAFFRIAILCWLIFNLSYHHKDFIRYILKKDKRSSLFWIEMILWVLLVIAIVYFTIDYFKWDYHFHKLYFDINPIDYS